MPKKKPFSIADYVAPSDVSKLDTSKVQQISVDEIEENSKNFYDTSDVDELVKSIEFNGLIEPVIVSKSDTGYRLISGHRRTKAFRELAQEQPDKFGCIPAIVREPQSQLIEELTLIEANRATRIMSSADLAKQAERYTELLVELKNQGVEIPGRLRDVVADAMQVSATKLARLNVIKNNLAEVFRPAYEAGKLNESTAYELAKLMQNVQEDIYKGRKLDEDDNIQYFYSHDVTDRGRLYEKLFCEPMAKADTSIPSECRDIICSNADNRWKVSVNKRYSYQFCDRCCCSCDKKAHCKYVCEKAKDAAEQEKQEEKERKAKERADKQKELDLRAKANELFWNHERMAREKASLSIETVHATKDVTYCLSLSQLEDYENGKKLDDYYASANFLGVDRIKALAELYGCTTDYLLGVSDKTTETATSKFISDEGGSLWVCTNCCHEFDLSELPDTFACNYKHCPECGAKIIEYVAEEVSE